MLVGIAILAAVRLGVIGGIAIGTSPPIPGGLLGITTVAGMIIGAINGLAMGLLVLAAERGRALDRIPWWRFALWGGAATGATAWLVFTTPVVALGCAALGAIASVGALALARRPTTDASDPTEPPPAA